MTFIQLIEFKTSRIDELNELLDGWLRETEGKRTATSVVLTSDRDSSGTYIDIVEFPSYEEAMRNSKLPETNRIAEQLTALCDGPPIYRNLDVMRQERT
ncbi:hypothetical protein ACFS2C_08315 [Prauserella oleivorans]|uniref:Antibiotic biosynthesis monooxygenase n=2 Tax=Prauserella oleivorans TaxID=1478153 RepID=A0ABW5W604_9PSEU